MSSLDFFPFSVSHTIMASSVSRALQLSDILHEIARWVPLFEHGPVSELLNYQYFPMFDHYEIKYQYTPFNLVSCTLVSRLWNTCFTPHLYHYYVDHRDLVGHSKDQHHLSFRQHSHLVRRFMSTQLWDQTKISLRLPYKLENPPKNLTGLFLFTLMSPLDRLLVHNQGSQLRQLVWTGGMYLQERTQERQDGFSELTILNEFEHQEALANLTSLEELELRRLNVSNELLYRILSGCAGTLRSLRLDHVQGFDQGCFEYHVGVDSDNTRRIVSRLTLPRLKSLRLLLASDQSKTSILLARHCPSLESIHITVDHEELPIPSLVAALRESCSHLTSISYYAMRHHDGYYPEPRTYASLVKDSFPSPRLQKISLGLPQGLDDDMMEALLFHATTLTEMELRCCSDNRLPSQNRTLTTMDMTKVATLLSQCHKLKVVRLLRVNCGLQALKDLFVEPWGCQGLESLLIEGYTPTIYMSFDSRLDSSVYQPQRDQLKSTRKQIRQNAWPRKFRHHEYRDDGQGWFLWPGMSEAEFFDVLVDGDWKRELFHHMYTTSGVKAAKYVRLNYKEFFSRERPFQSLRVEKKEMETEEDLVVDYRMMEP